MQVLSRCPLEVGSILWVPRAGAHTLTVVAKATFQLAPEESQLAPTQDPVIVADEHWDGDERKSLARATDLAPYKRHSEVLLVGHAYAPRGNAVGALQARLTVVEIDKPIDITGDRHFQLDGSISHPGRFTKMPLRWERAAGGPETSNPVGIVTGEEARPDGWGRVQVPNLVSSGRHVASRGDVIPPACYAPLASSWPTRRTRLHRYAGTFAPQAWATRPLPPDFDMGYFNAAPPDQYVREIIGTERMTLENLHPTIPLLQTRLCHVGPRATVDFGGGSQYEVPFVCDTLLIDTDRGVATLTYRAHVSLDYAERQGWVIVTCDAVTRAALPEWVHHVKSAHETVAGAGDEAPPAALPFVEEPTAEPDEEPAEISAAFDEEETFASARGDAPFPIVAPGAEVPGSKAFGAAALPPSVPMGPRLGAFRLSGKSDVPAPPASPAPVAAPKMVASAVVAPAVVAPAIVAPAVVSSAVASSIADDATIDPDSSWLTDTANEPPTAKPGAAPAGVAATPFEKKLPGTVAPFTPGVPPVPPSAAAKEPPTFGFRPRGTLVNVPVPTPNPMPFAPSASGSATPFSPPNTATSSATPFVAAPSGSASPFAPPPPPNAPSATPFTAPSAPSAASPFAPSATPFTAPSAPSAVSPFAPPPPPVGTPFAPPPPPAGMPFAPPPPPVGTPFAPPPPPAPVTGTPFAAPSAVSGMPFVAAGATPLPVVAMGAIAGAGTPFAPPPPAQGMTIGEMVTRQSVDAPARPVIEAPATFEPESTQDVAAGARDGDGSSGVVEPPRIGPLATPEMVASDLGVPPIAPEPEKAAAVAPAAPAGPPPLPLETYPLERCARIAASVARTREKKAAILASHELDDATWEALRTHWLGVIKQETERGKTEKLRAYDAAFVAQLEDERGPIVVEEYARIVVASERGTTSTTLAELGIPEAAVLRIQRVWMMKMGKDAELRRLARSAVEIASEA